MEANFDSNNTPENAQVETTANREGGSLQDGRSGKFLTEEQLLRLENALLRLNLQAREKVLLQLRLKALERDLELEQLVLREKTYQIKERMAGVRAKMAETSRLEDSCRQENQQLMESIAREHGLDARRIGYNPETREIII